MKRKGLPVTAAIFIAIFLAACGSKETPQTPDVTATIVPTQAAEPTLTPTQAVESTVAPTETEGAYPLTFSRYTGVYGEGFGLTMAASDESAEIFYTLDGSDPETSATAIKYTGAIPVESREGDQNVVSAIVRMQNCDFIRKT